MILTLPIDALIQNSILMPQRRELNTFTFRRDGVTKVENNVTLINFDPRNITNTTTLPKTSRYEANETLIGTSEPWATIEMINGITFGMSYLNGLQSAISAAPVVYCPTGSCDFGRYQNLGVGTVCMDRSDIVTRIGGDFPAWTIPGTDLRLNVSASDTTPQMIITSNSYTTYDPAQFEDITAPLILRTALLVDAWKGKPPVGMECILIWLVNTLESKIDQSTNQTLLETAVYVHWNWTVNDERTAFKCFPGECWIQNRTVTEEQDPVLYHEECVSTVSIYSNRGIQNFLLDRERGLNGNLFAAPDNLPANPMDWTPLNNFIANINGILERQRNNREAFLVNIPQFFLNIAAGMTQIVRQERILRANGTTRAGFTTGNVYQFIFYYKIAWWRLSLPALLVLASVAFVTITALITREDLDWRRSNLPLLFHGLADREKQGCGEVLQLADMERAAEGLQVKLVDAGEGVRLLSGRGWDDDYHGEALRTFRS